MRRETRFSLRWIAASSAARMLRVSRQRIYQLIDAHELVGQTVDRHVYVLADSVRERLEKLGRGERDARAS